MEDRKQKAMNNAYTKGRETGAKIGAGVANRRATVKTARSLRGLVRRAAVAGEDTPATMLLAGIADGLTRGVE